MIIPSHHAPGLPKGFERLGLVHVAVGMCEPGGVSLVMNATPAPTEDTTNVKPTSMAEGATTPKPEALEPWAGGQARRERDTVLDKGAT